MIYGTTVQESFDYRRLYAISESEVSALMEEYRAKFVNPGIVGNLAFGYYAEIFAQICNQQTIDRMIQKNDVDGLVELFGDNVDALNKMSNFELNTDQYRLRMMSAFVAILDYICYYGDGKKVDFLIDPGLRIIKTIFRCESLKKRHIRYLISCVNVRKKRLKKFLENPETTKQAKQADQLFDKYIKLCEEKMKEIK